MTPEQADLLRRIDEAVDRPAWHGANLRYALRGVDARAALWRPARGYNSIWELLLHLTYTRHRVLGRLGDDPHPRFPRQLTKSWWPELPEVPDAAAWRADLRFFRALHQRFRSFVAEMPAARLRVVLRGRGHTLAREIAGVAEHDIYHVGQMQLVKKLYRGRLTLR